MSLCLMEVKYESNDVPYLPADFVEKLCDRFCLDDKMDHFYIDDLDVYDEELKEYTETLKTEGARDLKEFEKHAKAFGKFLEKHETKGVFDGVEFCAGW